MVRLRTKTVHKHHSRISVSENRHKTLLRGTIFAITAIATLVTLSTASTPKTPVRTSILTGQLWLTELYASPVRMYEQLGMAKHVFCKLCTELQMLHGLSDGKFLLYFENLHDNCVVGICPTATSFFFHIVRSIFRGHCHSIKWI